MIEMGVDSKMDVNMFVCLICSIRNYNNDVMLSSLLAALFIGKPPDGSLSVIVSILSPVADNWFFLQLLKREQVIYHRIMTIAFQLLRFARP